MATSDVVIVGAGVIGSAVALELARSGWSVTVVDRASAPGLGSTSASSAIVRFTYSTYAGVALSWEARHCWQDFGEHLGAAADEPLARLRTTGFALLDAPVIDMTRTTGLFDRVGIAWERWDPAQLRASVPGIDTGRYWPPKRVDDEAFWQPADGEVGALWSPEGGFVDDPQLAAVNLAGAARRAGATFVFSRSVVDVPSSSGRVSGVRLDDGTAVSAPVVVNVAGPWSSALNRLAGVGGDFTVRVRPMRQEVHHVAAPAGYNDGERLGPVIGDLDLGIYLRAAPGDALLVGGTEPECDPLQWLDDPDVAHPHPTQVVSTAQLTRAARRFPALTVPPRPRGVVGVYDVADDWTPIYDRTALDGYYVAMGTSGNQFKNAPAAGQLMATLIRAVEDGHDHDGEPVQWSAPRTAAVIGLEAFSRRRAANAASTGTVMG
jgi:glycine/D-amino acid oxidase-like deaminating enzyme